MDFLFSEDAFGAGIFVRAQLILYLDLGVSHKGCEFGCRIIGQPLLEKI